MPLVLIKFAVIIFKFIDPYTPNHTPTKTFNFVIFNTRFQKNAVQKSLQKKDLKMSTIDELKELQHELRTHQIELEMQNEELRAINLTLQMERNRYAILYDFAPIGYLTLNHQGRIIKSNFSAAELLESTNKKLLDKHFISFIASENSDKWHLFFIAAMKQNKRQSIVLKIKQTNSAEIYIHMDCQHNSSIDNDSTLFVSLTDVSERIKNEIRLQQLVNQEHAWRIEQSQFITILAHELKNLLAVIQLALALITESDEIVSIVNKVVQDITNLVQRCLQSEKLNDQQVEVYIENHNLFSEFEKIKKNVSASNRLVINVDSSLTFNTDGQLIYTILLNLIDNALKYSPSNSLVIVNVEIDVDIEKSQFLVITVHNEIGIAGSPDQSKVFHKYYRNKAAHHEIGLGLGLYIVKAMTDLLGGEIIYLYDDNYVCFTLRFPYSNDATQKADL
jgi:signal transduction histidine kinase